MKLEDQVCSLELAKKLKELGVKQESLFYWSKPFDINNYFTGYELYPETMSWLEYHEMENAAVYSAFTVAELGEMLPAKLGDKNNPSYFTCWKEPHEWQCAYQKTFAEDCYMGAIMCLNNTEADARAKMLIYLIENKII